MRGQSMTCPNCSAEGSDIWDNQLRRYVCMSCLYPATLIQSCQSQGEEKKVIREALG